MRGWFVFRIGNALLIILSPIGGGGDVPHFSQPFHSTVLLVGPLAAPFWTYDESFLSFKESVDPLS